MTTQSMYTGLIIVLPTRNRSDLAMLAIASVLRSTNSHDIHLVVSDNSSEPEESQRLAQYCGIHKDRLNLIRPATPLPMAEHWEWALEQALDLHQASHIAFLTDRMLFRDNALGTLTELLESHPTDVLSYTYDRINDLTIPVAVEQIPRSGRLLSIDSAKLLELSAQMVFYSCLPRMLNCAVPRTTIARIKKQFGNVFLSICPDFCFCYRILDLEERILYWDKSIMINHAISRSNGATVSRGTRSKDNDDFIRQVGKQAINRHAPYPEVMTVGNAIISEYLFVKEHATSAKFRELSHNAYLDGLAVEAYDFADTELKDQTFAVLRAHGWAPKSRFLYKRIAQKLIRSVLRPFRPTFAGLEQAIQFATARLPRDFPGIEYLIPRYANMKVVER